MTPLRRRMIEDLRIRNRSPRTIEAYVRSVARFAAFHRRSPEQLGPEDVRTYQVLLLERKTSWSVLNLTVCALRFHGPGGGEKGRVRRPGRERDRA